MRKGEIRFLRWRDVHGMSIEDGRVAWGPNPELHLLAENTKTKTFRRVPISEELKRILVLRRIDPWGAPMPLDTYVFGTRTGERLPSFTHRWWTAILNAHGTLKVWDKRYGRLT